MRAPNVKRALDILTNSEDADTFFDRVVEALAVVAESRWALVLMPSDTDGCVVSKAFWFEKGLLPAITVNLDIAPCSVFYQDHEPKDYVFIEQLQKTFNRFPLTEALNYEGASFGDDSGKVIGHVAVLHDQPRTIAELDKLTFQLFVKHIACVHRGMRLQKEFDIYHQMIRCAPHLISLVDNNYVYRVVSKGYEAFFGKTRDEIVGKSVKDIHGEKKFNTFMKKHLDECLDGGAVSSRRWVEPQGRDPFFIDVHQAPCFDKEGNIIGVLTSAHDITESKLEEDHIARIAHLDHLTGLPNRRFLFQHLQQELPACQKHAKMSALFFIDLDGFKDVNDQYGHATGDAVLEIVAKRLRRSVRKDDVLARIGGDEFVLLISNAWEASQADEEAKLWAEKLLAELSEPINSAGKMININASIGVHIIGRDDASSDDVINKADIAMYNAKHDVARRVCLG